MLRLPPIPTLFPSRRSSDLLNPGRRTAGADGTPRPRVRQQVRATMSGLMPGNLRESWFIGPVEVPTRVVLAPMAGVSRSEEHTSELQSQFHLVCRLLLEKKK